MAHDTTPPLFGTVEFFIERHRPGIVPIIRRRLPQVYTPGRPITDGEIRLWVLNDPELWDWAIREGVRHE
jgi:hypothetical protein